uniref:C2 domain-containing protein n=1 Tax=Pygocentrus nattereri TaxID=42514 RepID=A0AAR2KIM0_PYGNA
PNPNAQIDGDVPAGESGKSLWFVFFSLDGTDGDEDPGEWGDTRASGEPPTPGQPGKPPQKMMRMGRKRQKALANKPQDFQIRIRIIEGRQLPGNNIKPVVKVSVCGQTHRTRIRRGNNPFFDELTLTVYNSFSLRSDSLLGEFKVIYDPLTQKWLLLSDPDDSSSGARGYLKVSMIIMGTGDDPPVEKREQIEEVDDIESNLLLPAGVTLRSATLSLKVYRAEDMPQMDDAFAQSVKHMFGGESDKKNLVDPFLEVSFAGKKFLSYQFVTKVCVTCGKSCLPLFYIIFNPTLSRYFLFGRDRFSSNDAVGTTYLDLTKIASSGGEIEGNVPHFCLATVGTEVGFLPAFGPCYLNLYGSLREFSDLSDPYEELNLGKGEGVAYRGRVLIELSTRLDDKIDKKVDDLSNDDILVAQKYQRKRKYSLCAVFHSACMLQEPGEPIQFEVSIGNYGNKMDSTCKPLASTTQYSCAVFDGNNYYYLPWANTKPVVILTSFWEDISHRLDAVNIVLFTADRLVCFLCSTLCTIFQLPDIEGKANLTALDIQIKKLRDRAIVSIREAARHMREEATDVKATLTDIEEWLERLQQIAEEPQNSMPDIIIWMLRGEKRMAYARIPANQVLFSTHSDQATGKYCGKTQTIFMQYPMDKNKGVKIPVQLRLNVWLGLSAHEKKFNTFAEGTFSVYAEMYENQAQMFGKWGTTGLVGRHKFSDVTGKIKLKQECFLPPRGWEWEGDWFIDPERCLLTEADAGHTEFTDEVFQNESRFPGGEWKPATEPYTDVNGEKAQSPEEIECPPGWKWEDEWSFDSNRAVDEKGWEYGITIPPDDKPSSWVAAEKMYHIHRRKRLVRLRKKTKNTPTVEKEAGDGWEYSSLIGWKFHRKERSSDTFRRRRWRRKMAPGDSVGASAIFKLEGLSSRKENITSVYSLLFNVMQNLYNIYIQCHTIIKATLNPTWDQTLLFNDIEIYGDPQTIAHNPPSVVMELFDSDQVGKDEAMGRCVCPPVVKLNPGSPVTPKLLWFPVTMKGRSAGEILVAAELLLKDKFLRCDPEMNCFPFSFFLCVQTNESEMPLVPPKRAEKLYMVPQGIRPVVQLTAIEILAWGLRNMKTYQMAAVSSPSLIIECGGHTVQTAVIKNIKKCPNFPGSVLFLKVLLPKEEMYTPPIVLKVIDHRPFGRKPIVGQCTVDSLEEFRCDPYMDIAEVSRTARGKRSTDIISAPGDVIIDIEDRRPVLDSQVDEAVDWWSKFFASVGEHEKCGPYLQKGYATLSVYDKELEAMPDFHGLTDFCNTFKLFRGKTDDDEEDPSVVGEFKGSFRVYPLSDDPEVPAPPRQFRELPESGPQECVVRIYVVRCIDLQPKDNNGLCDPYIKITLGKKTIDDRDNYKPNTLNPEFGRMFEMSCFLPQDKDLKISIYDFDLLSRDEKVGDTIIDLENRLLSRFGSHCGLPQMYCVSGVNQWRDQLKPSQILQNLARLRGLPPPQIADDGSSLSFGGREYNLHDLEASKVLHQHLGPAKERICLHVLRKQGLVPEHVETRTLHSSYQPTLSQGRIQMWVDVFPKNLGIPGPPVDITPRKAKKYFLRAVIWNTSDVILDETSITGEHMSDIYVKGWMPGMEEDKQKTDVHYRSLDGDGNFNWRFVFGFDYLPAEQLCLVSRKEHFWSLDKTEFRIPPKLIIQIWDNDKFSLDDYLGTVELDLIHLMPPSKTPEKCSLNMLTQGAGRNLSSNSLFAQKSVRGWWPCAMEEDGKKLLTGKVEMTLEIVDEKEVEERPAGKGREEPNMNPRLEPPNRPDTSFLWFTNPCKTMKFIVWRRFKWVFIGGIILILVLLFVGVLLYSLPVSYCISLSCTFICE